MKIEVTNSQRLALVTLLTQVAICMAKHPDENNHSEEFIDCSVDPAITVKAEELALIFMAQRPANLLPEYERIPPALLEGLRRYSEDHLRTGGFLQTVLENDLRMAFMRADDHSKVIMYDLVAYIQNELPPLCWGSPEAVSAWLTDKRYFKR